MNRKIVGVVASVIMTGASFLMSSCSEYSKLTKNGTTEEQFEKAFEYYEKGDYFKAATLWEGTIPSYRGTEKGEKGLFHMAMAHFYNKDFLNAKNYFSAYCKGYPSGTYAEEAKFRMACCYYNESPDVKLDQTYTQKAIDEFTAFISMYPNSLRLSEAKDMLKEMYEKLAEKEYLNVKLYYDLGDYMGNNYQSAVVTASNALKKFPDTKYKEELHFLILVSKYEQAVRSVESKMEDRYRDTVDEYYTFVNEFPESSHIKDADKFLKKSQKYLEGLRVNNVETK